DALLADVGRLAGADVDRDVAGEGDVLGPGLVRDGEVDVAGQEGVDLDEVGAGRPGVAYGLPGLLGGRETDRAGPDGPGAVEDVARHDEPGPEELALGDLLPPAVMIRPDRDAERRIAPHHADARDAVGDE